MQQLRQPLVFSQQLRVLLQNHLHLLLQLTHLLTLRLQYSILLLQHDQISTQQLLNSRRVVIQLRCNGLPSRTAISSTASEVPSIPHLTNQFKYNITLLSNQYH